MAPKFPDAGAREMTKFMLQTVKHYLKLLSRSFLCVLKFGDHVIPQIEVSSAWPAFPIPLAVAFWTERKADYFIPSIPSAEPFPPR
ncbi:MAG: hypothetical protein Q9203_007269 [Teloschistes exilis]